MAPGTLATFGITGQTGRAAAEAPLARGWTVRGLARAPSRADGLERTLVKPPRLTPASVARPVQAGPALRMALVSRIGRASLAQFVLDALERDRFIGERVIVRN